MTPKKHKEIAVAACLPILHKAFPEEQLGYFLLGNWFTDVSQGIAPVDYAAGMADARKEGVASAKKDSWFLNYLVPDFLISSKVNQFVRELLGSPPPKNSAMAEWFRNAVYVAGWCEFCWNDGPAKNLADLGAGPIAFEEYDRIYHGDKLGKASKGRFTQYFPHEHFDRWPMDRTEKSPRQIYQYLEDHILNIAELLTLVDRDWAKYRKTEGDESNKRRHDIVAEFGYALHTTEDYWAHTNFADFAMRMIGQIPASVDERRKHERRLLRDVKPRTEMFAEPGPTEPEDHVVGGYFDGIDTRFSLLQLWRGVMESMAHRSGYKSAVWKCGAQDCPGHKKRDHKCSPGVWRCRRVKPPCPTHQSPGHRCPDKDGQEWNCGESKCPGHRKRDDTCKNGTWHCGRTDPVCPGHERPGHQCDEMPASGIDWRHAKTKEQRERYKSGLTAKQVAMGMPQKVRDAEMAFIQLDWNMMDRWDGKCVSWVLEKMLNEGESYTKKKFKDGSFYGERVGSHTLIAKDDETKEPGVPQAMNLAKRVDKYICETMVRDVKGPPKPVCKSVPQGKDCNALDTRVWVDWLDLLKYFCGHPAKAEEFEPKGQPKLMRGVKNVMWWMPAMATGDGEHNHALKFIKKDVVDERAKLNTRRRLEQDHNSMISVENVKYEAQRCGDGHTIEKRETLANRGDEHVFDQDDMDLGTVRVKCLNGEVRIETYAAVWSEFKRLSWGQVKAGNVWQGDFTEQSSTYDQTNRTVVTATTDAAEYEIAMVSYDK